MNAPLEKHVQRTILDYLALRGAFAIRINSSAFVGAKTDSTARRFVRSNDRPGCSDILAVYRGMFIAIEVKRPGGKLTPEQAAFLDQVRQHGGYGIVADGIDAVRVLLDSILERSEL